MQKLYNHNLLKDFEWIEIGNEEIPLNSQIVPISSLQSESLILQIFTEAFEIE